MALDRRNFIRTSLGSAALATVAACTGTSGGGNKNENAGDGKCCKNGLPYNPKAKLNISFQQWTLAGDVLKDKLDFMEKLGVNGLEVGGKGLSGRVDELKQALEGRNIKISAICAGFEGFMLSEEDSVQNACLNSMKEIITAAGKLGSTGVIIVPAFNSQKPVMPHTQETRDFLCRWFDDLGTFAKENGTTVILEPLNRREAFYLRQVADAASICRDINNPGVTCLGDFWHMTWEETSDLGAFVSGGKYIQHVHIASRKRRLMPGEDGEADNYVDGFRGLKIIGFDKYISFECDSKAEDRNASAAAGVELIRKQWEEA
ncbi:MAG: sugar phosphate isomerase/epimerase [Tannerella sp.]|jgi:sugar phosphate isomerase/epimerase|nr:sugar phosphate isomerase/epimerase [Tannerella sp.]